MQLRSLKDYRITDKQDLGNDSIATFASPHGDKGLRGEIIERSFCDALLNHDICLRLGFTHIRVFKIDERVAGNYDFLLRSIWLWSGYRGFAIFVSTTISLHDHTLPASIHRDRGYK